MSYKLRKRKKGDILYVEATGIRTVQAVSAMAREIVEVCLTKQTSKVLVDVRQLDGRLSTLGAYEVVAKDFPELRRLGLLKAAVIVDDPNFLDRARFFETVARNRNFNLRIFGDVGEALRWLKHSGEV